MQEHLSPRISLSSVDLTEQRVSKDTRALTSDYQSQEQTHLHP